MKPGSSELSSYITGHFHSHHQSTDKNTLCTSLSQSLPHKFKVRKTGGILNVLYAHWYLNNADSNKIKSNKSKSVPK